MSVTWDVRTWRVCFLALSGRIAAKPSSQLLTPNGHIQSHVSRSELDRRAIRGKT
jgi:hypothetical protein